MCGEEGRNVTHTHGQGKNRDVLAWHRGKSVLAKTWLRKEQRCAYMAQGKACACIHMAKEGTRMCLNGTWPRREKECACMAQGKECACIHMAKEVTRICLHDTGKRLCLHGTGKRVCVHTHS